ncbi:MAG: hypothetical protein JNM25_00260 [Planctomycetes bacterium]|nr:hypothetical protein [Planctomycetota bacterium]
MKVSGTWHGEYTYGEIYDFAGKSVPFTMSLTESWLRRIAGYVRDDASKGGMPERGRILGTRRGSTIEFVKTMPVGYVTDPDGQMVETRSWLQRAFGIANPPAAPHCIEYVGELAADGQSVRGQWRIRPRVVAEDEQGQHLFGGGTGTWSARRIADLPTEV